MTNQLIGTRIKALRQARGVSQDELARLFGFKDRQTVSAIETVIRRITASELLLAVEKFGVPLDYFTDPFRLDGEGLFSWRQTGIDPERLSEYERTAGRWIGAYRTLAAKVGRRAPLMRRALGLNRLSRFEDAMDAGERFVAELDLEPVPALRLAAVMEEELGILVLMVDAQEGISGAACRLPELDAVLIARNRVSVDGAAGAYAVVLRDADKLLTRLTLGDDNRVRFMEVDFTDGCVREPRRQRIADELAAFGNTLGGALISSVSDAGEVRWTSRGSLHTAARCTQVTDGMIWIEMDGKTDGDMRP